jgi:hypothetical protein
MWDQDQPMFLPFGENVLLCCYIVWQLFLWCWSEFFLCEFPILVWVLLMAHLVGAFVQAAVNSIS